MRTLSKFKAVILTGIFCSGAMAAAAISDMNEEVLMRHNDAREAHDRQASAEIARQRTKGALDQARFVFNLESILFQRNAIPRWDLLHSQQRLLQAMLADRFALYVVEVSGLEMRMQDLRASWRDGTVEPDISQLAKLFVEKRQMRVAQSEANLNDLREIARIRKELHSINESLANGHVVSAEALNESKVNANQAEAEVVIATRELAQARESLADAQRDLEAAARH
jgi:hypothetical protein